MKITSIKPLIVYGKLINWIFVKVETDVGLVGWGEATLEWKPKGVVGCIEDLSQLAIGQDPRRTEFLWQRLYRQYFIKPGIVALAAISGIDQACWDIHAKSLGVPLYQILGGAVRDRVRMYDHLGGGEAVSVYETATAEQFVEQGRRSIEAGYTALKVLIIGQTRALDTVAKVKKAESLMRALREGLGDEIDIMLDLHGRTSPDMAIVYGKALEPYRPYWMEEPCPPENVEGLVKVAKAINIPIASGERVVTRFGFRPILERSACAVIQPDVCHTGGITEIRKIASMADTYYVGLAPHNPLGPIATAVNVHLALSTPNFLIQESWRSDVPWRNDVVKNPILIEQGHAHPSDAPGIGVEVDEVEARKHPYEREQILLYFNEDGSVADW